MMHVEPSETFKYPVSVLVSYAGPVVGDDELHRGFVAV